MAVVQLEQMHEWGEQRGCILGLRQPVLRRSPLYL